MCRWPLQDGRAGAGAGLVVIDPDHRQYCRFDLETQAGLIAMAHGGRGPNTDYLFNTVAHLQAMGIADANWTG